MEPSHVLITGAGGFVGGRLAHSLALGSDKEVTGLLHTPSGANAMRLARLPIDIEQGSVTDAITIREILDDVDTIVNCAFGMGKTSVDGTKILLREAENADVERFVHLSSAVVHGHDFEGTIDETSAFAPDTEYGQWKVRGEQVIERRRSQLSFDPSIFRPLIIYGPHSHWVTDALATVRQGAILADGGNGTLNQIYIDNLIHAIVLAIDEPDAAGETFLIADEDQVTWRQYYDNIGQLVGHHPPIKTMSSQEISRGKAAQLLRDSIVPPARIPKRILASRELRSSIASELSKTPWAEPALGHLPESIRSRIVSQLQNGDHNRLFEEEKNTETEVRPSEPAYAFPEKRMCSMQSTTGKLSTARARAILGWDPAITFSDSMHLLDDWISYENLLTGNE